MWKYYEKLTFFHRKPLFKKKLKFSSEIIAKFNKKSRAVNIAQWNIDFQYQDIEDIDTGIDIEFRFLRILILILILHLEKILVLILILILIVFQGQYWYWSWYWKWNFRKYWYWYWTTIWYCPTSVVETSPLKLKCYAQPLRCLFDIHIPQGTEGIQCYAYGVASTTIPTWPPFFNTLFLSEKQALYIITFCESTILR